MADMNNLANPYANAIFEIAKANNSFDLWSTHLNKLALIVQDEELQGLITSPSLTHEQLLAILLGSLDNPDAFVSNFLELLLKNGRLLVLPEIANLFTLKVREQQNTAAAIIQSAFAMSDQEKKQFEELLGNKFNKTITATVEVNPLLIGGVKILIDDTVIDASVKGSLEKMATKLIR